MILSKLMTANNLLAIAAALIKDKLTILRRDAVFVTVSGVK